VWIGHTVEDDEKWGSRSRSRISGGEIGEIGRYERSSERHDTLGDLAAGAQRDLVSADDTQWHADGAGQLGDLVDDRGGVSTIGDQDFPDGSSTRTEQLAYGLASFDLLATELVTVAATR